MSEGTCTYCGTWSRNRCDEDREAATCPNNDNRGAYMDFKASDVAEWIRANSTKDDVELRAAADLIEERL
jgi:hypothetical protein